jgi:hypothetical protein
VSRVLVVPDLQIPFAHPYALTFLKRIREAYKPHVIVNVGDEWDNCALSRYPHDPDGQSAGEEHKRAIRASLPFYREFPRMMLCESNHRGRLYKRAFEAGIPAGYIRDTRGYMRCPRTWRWAEFWVVDGVRYEHGDRSSGPSCGLKLIDANHKSTVYGHHHSSAGLGYTRVAEKTLFWMNVGCLIDEHTYAMSYTKMHRTKPVLSCGTVTDGVPQLIPMTSGGRTR